MPDHPPASSPQPPRARWRPSIQARLSALRLAPEREAEIVDELSDDLDDRWRDLVSGGVEPDAATALILDDLRGRNLLAHYMAPLKQANHRPLGPEPRSGNPIADGWQDVRYAVRTLLRQPAFAAAAILTLALAIGVNTTLFGMVRSVLLEALPYPDANRLYRLQTVDGQARHGLLLSPPDFMAVREHTTAFSHVEAYTVGLVTMTGAGDPREVRAATASHGLFEPLGINVAAGRGFVREDHQPGAKSVVLLDHGFWQRAFGGDPGAIGRSIRIGGALYLVVGVLAEDARLPVYRPELGLPSGADVYMPLMYGAAFDAATTARRDSRYLAVLAKLKPEVTAAQANQDLERLSLRLQASYPESAVSFIAIPALEVVVGDVRRPLLVLLGAVGFVLLIACANVASLMLARGSARREELTVRAALGAGRSRLVRLLIAEAGVIGCAGGVIGLALASAGLRALVAARPADIPRIEDIGIDGAVVFFTLGISLVASVLFGALPAMRATGTLTPGLRTGGRGGGADRRSRRLRSGLIVCEIALAVVLLTGAGLLMRSLAGMTSTAPGFVAQDVTSFRVALFGQRYSPEGVLAWVNQVQADLRAQRGVVAAAVSSRLPLSGAGQLVPFAIEGTESSNGATSPEAGLVSITPGYLNTIGARMLAGRDFDAGDRKTGMPVAIVNESAVRRWFQGTEPLGKRVTVAGETREIVGVVADILQGDPRLGNAPQMYVPFEQRQIRTISVVVRSIPDMPVAPTIRAAVQRADPDLAISDLQLLTDRQAQVVARPRFYSAVLILCAVIALVLAATGIFGVMSYLAAERTREFGIRMALGAGTNDVLFMVLGRSLLLTVVGVTAGVAGAVALGRLIRSQLFGVDVLDPVTLTLVVLTLVTTATLAAWIPARRASKLDPVKTLNRA